MQKIELAKNCLCKKLLTAKNNVLQQYIQIKTKPFIILALLR